MLIFRFVFVICVSDVTCFNAFMCVGEGTLGFFAFADHLKRHRNLYNRKGKPFPAFY